MKLPNGEKAVVEIAKLRDYCLSLAHPEGRYKARVFRSVLGIGPAESHMLQERLLAAARDQDAVVGEVDEIRPPLCDRFSVGACGTPSAGARRLDRA